MFKNMLKGKGGAATPQAGGSASVGGKAGSGPAAKLIKAMGATGGAGGGATDKETQAIIKKILASQGVKMNKGGKVNSKRKAKPMQSKKKSTSKKVSGHNRLY